MSKIEYCAAIVILAITPLLRSGEPIPPTVPRPPVTPYSSVLKLAPYCYNGRYNHSLSVVESEFVKGGLDSLWESESPELFEAALVAKNFGKIRLVLSGGPTPIPTDLEVEESLLKRLEKTKNAEIAAMIYFYLGRVASGQSVKKALIAFKTSEIPIVRGASLNVLLQHAKTKDDPELIRSVLEWISGPEEQVDLRFIFHFPSL